MREAEGSCFTPKVREDECCPFLWSLARSCWDEEGQSCLKSSSPGAAVGDGVTFGQPWVLLVHLLNTWNLHLDALRQKLVNLISASPG